jgi:hypothetical protein
MYDDFAKDQKLTIEELGNDLLKYRRQKEEAMQNTV